jgi:hypothetical protein
MVMLAGAWGLIAWAVVVMAFGVYRRLRSGPAAVPRRTAWTAMPVAGAAAAAVVVVGASFDRPALGLLLAGPVFCLFMAAAAVLGELVVRPPTGARRLATISARSALDYAERPQMVAVGAVFAVATAFLGTAALFGDADDRGRPGRWLQLSSPFDERFGWTILWPGAYYALPLLAALGLAVLTIAAALRRIAARPRPDVGASASDPVAADEEARRCAAEVVLAAGGVAAAAALCGAGLVAASGLSGAGALWPVLGILLWVVVVAAAAVGAWSAAVLVTPGRVRRTAVPM